MKIKKMFLWLLVFPVLVNAQIKGVVKDSISGKPIQYVSILIENKNIGATTDEFGRFEIEKYDKNQDKLLFNILGYKLKKVSNGNTNEVLLTPISILLNEVKIAKKPKKKLKTIRIGNAHKTLNMWFTAPNPVLYCKKFDYEDKFIKTPYLKEVIVYARSDSAKATFKVKIFAYDTIKKIPSKSLLDEEIIATALPGENKIIVDVSKLYIEIPKEGIVVGVETILCKENLIVSKRGNTYGPGFYINRNNKNSFAYLNFEWIDLTEHKIDNSKGELKVYMTKEPCINLTLSN